MELFATVLLVLDAFVAIFVRWAKHAIASSIPKVRRARWISAPNLHYASIYVTKHGKMQCYDFEAGHILFSLLRTWSELKMERLVWHDVIFDQFYERIHAITRDSSRKRVAILEEIFPKDIATLIVECVWERLRRQRKKRQRGTK